MGLVIGIVVGVIVTRKRGNRSPVDEPLDMLQEPSQDDPEAL